MEVVTRETMLRTAINRTKICLLKRKIRKKPKQGTTEHIPLSELTIGMIKPKHKNIFFSCMKQDAVSQLQSLTLVFWGYQQHENHAAVLLIPAPSRCISGGSEEAAGPCPVPTSPPAGAQPNLPAGRHRPQPPAPQLLTTHRRYPSTAHGYESPEQQTPNAIRSRLANCWVNWTWMLLEFRWGLGEAGGFFGLCGGLF